MLRVIRRLQYGVVLAEGPTFDRERVTETMLEIQRRFADAVLGPNVKPQLLNTESSRAFFRDCRQSFDAGGAVSHSITGPYVMFLSPLGGESVVATFKDTYETCRGKPVDAIDVTPSFTIEATNPDRRNDATCSLSAEQHAFVMKFLEPEIQRYGLEIGTEAWLKVLFPHSRFGTGHGEFRLRCQDEFY